MGPGKKQEVFEKLLLGIKGILERETTSIQKLRDTYHVFSQLFVFLGDLESIHFATLFARIAFLSAKYEMPRLLRFQLHTFRRDAEAALESASAAKPDPDTLWQQGIFLTVKTAAICFQLPFPRKLFEILDVRLPVVKQQGEVVAFKKSARLLAIRRGEDRQELIACDEESPEEEVRLLFGIPGRSDIYVENIESGVRDMGFPFSICAVDIEISEGNTYSPRMLVVDPDHLIDVTAIAYCFDSAHAEPYTYLINKFITTQANPALSLGNIANFFLDELIRNPDAGFDVLFPQVFKHSPLVFATFADKEIHEIYARARLHFDNLKHAVSTLFPANGIERTRCFLEPSFFSPTFGIQGRLDVYHPKPGSADIVELKSGKPFRANIYGLNQNHYTQTLLYDLLIKSVNAFTLEQTNYILYSSQSVKTLRYAPPVDSLQREAIQVRNALVNLEARLAGMDIGQPGVLDLLHPDRFPKLKAFQQRDMTVFSDVFHQLTELEKRYFRVFARFIAREHRLAKLGLHGQSHINGLASLWLDSREDKEEKFNILQGLKIAGIEVEEDATLKLNRSEKTNPLANFRTGDIAVLYPEMHRYDAPLRTQIYKCTLTGIDEEHISVRLRNKQINYSDIQSHSVWILEHDVLDSSFVSLYKALFEFASAPEAVRARILGLSLPEKPAWRDPGILPAYLNASQRPVLGAMLLAERYYLLWGPPGTGKTQVMLRAYVEYILKHTTQRLLLLAYTNRAVDEICAALESIDDSVKSLYLRIGSRTATRPKYRAQLLISKTEHIRSRRALIALLETHRIVVSTISSILGKQEIFGLMSFDCVIIDEASQILEPSLGAILTKTKKWILIGDHRQLPAVVMQEPHETRVDDDLLNTIGLRDTAESYFERMFRIVSGSSAHWTFGSLHIQGRMNREIMAFPSRHFYQGNLKTLQGGKRDLDIPLRLLPPESGNRLYEILCQHRLIYFPTKVEPAKRLSKTNDEEAECVVSLVVQLRQILQYNGMKQEKDTIGIITPFRAQIANIRDKFVNRGVAYSDITIDTVERYQGGARDIVILSLCVNDPVHFHSVISLSRDGVDRKLNVAVTRAREQFILIGNPEMLRLNPLYGELVKSCVLYRNWKTDKPG